MRLLLRLIGTWLVAVALVLLIIDGTRSLGNNRLVLTSLADTWSWINAESLEQARLFLGSRFFAALLDPVWAAILQLPAWVVIGIPGAIVAWMGRTRRARVFVRQDQF